MSAPYNSYEYKCEDALKQVIEENIQTQLPVHLGFDYDELTEDTFCLITATSFAAVQEDLGGGDVELVVAVMSDRSVSRIEHETVVGAVMDLIYNTGLTAEMNRIVDDMGVNVITHGARNRAMVETTRVTTQTLTATCWAKDDE